jgi:hypothetical protein
MFDATYHTRESKLVANEEPTGDIEHIVSEIEQGKSIKLS